MKCVCSRGKKTSCCHFACVCFCVHTLGIVYFNCYWMQYPGLCQDPIICFAMPDDKAKLISKKAFFLFFFFPDFFSFGAALRQQTASNLNELSLWMAAEAVFIPSLYISISRSAAFYCSSRAQLIRAIPVEHCAGQESTGLLEQEGCLKLRQSLIT